MGKMNRLVYRVERSIHFLSPAVWVMITAKRRRRSYAYLHCSAQETALWESSHGTARESDCLGGRY